MLKSKKIMFEYVFKKLYSEVKNQLSKMNRVLVSLSNQNLFWPELVVCTDLFLWNFELIEISSGVLKLSHENILEMKKIWKIWKNWNSHSDIL